MVLVDNRRGWSGGCASRMTESPGAAIAWGSLWFEEHATSIASATSWVLFSSSLVAKLPGYFWTGLACVPAARIGNLRPGRAGSYICRRGRGISCQSLFHLGGTRRSPQPRSGFHAMEVLWLRRSSSTAPVVFQFSPADDVGSAGSLLTTP